MAFFLDPMSRDRIARLCVAHGAQFPHVVAAVRGALAAFPTGDEAKVIGGVEHSRVSYARHLARPHGEAAENAAWDFFVE